MLYYGVSWYPEQKTQEEYTHDLKLLAESGINLARLGEFAWCRMEPKEGHFDLEWLAKAVEDLGSHGIRSVICTPTACPPKWLCEKHPEMMYVDNKHFTRPFGGRRHYCYTNELYRSYCQRIARKIAERFGEHPDVIGYQIDNELAQENTGRCTCPACRQAFGEYLKQQFGTIEAFNREAGTVFWGQEYDRFDQIAPPVASIEPGTTSPIEHYFDNPAVRLWWERFCSHQLTEFQDIQTRALRHVGNKLISTNGTGLATNSIDYYDSFHQLDRYGFDYYPSLREGAVSGAPYAHGRGVKPGSPFWVLEFQAGGGHGLRGMGRLQPYPGAIAQSVAHAFFLGAEMMCHFQFRSFPHGAEQLNYAIVDADGVPRRRYREMCETAALTKRLDALLDGTKGAARVAVTFDYATLWALRIKPINHDFDYLAYVEELYEVVSSMGIPCDIIGYGDDFSRYEAILMPAPAVLTDAITAKMKAYVKGGGRLISGFLAGIKNEHNAGRQQLRPCGLDDLFGLSVDEVEPVVQATASLVKAEGFQGRNRSWTESLDLAGAQAVAHYADTFRQGQAVIAKNAYGAGSAWYLGTRLHTQEMTALLDNALNEIPRMPFGPLPQGVQAFAREKDGKLLYSAFNFTLDPMHLPLSAPLDDAITGARLTDQLTLFPKGFALLWEA